MKTILVNGKKGYRAFQSVQKSVYRKNRCFRGTEGSVERMLICGPTVFHDHSRVETFLIQDGKEVVGRFALIKEESAPNTIQVSFFEALSGITGVLDIIKNQIHQSFPECKKFIVGLNGHLNYGAGFLLNKFDEVPLFGLPYSQPYYPAYFEELYPRKMFSFRLPIQKYSDWSRNYKGPRQMDNIQLRYMNKKKIKKEVGIYTRLNNGAFQEHPYWADRKEEEDFELFYPFRFLLDNENLVLAEYKGKPIGFVLWYPDFNQLVSNQLDLNIWHVLRYRLNNPIDTCRFTEIGILPGFTGSPVALAMLDYTLPIMEKAGYKYCEMGFVFEENRPSVLLCKRILTRCGLPPEPYREYAVFEGSL